MSSGGFSPEPTLDGGGSTDRVPNGPRFLTGVQQGWHAIEPAGLGDSPGHAQALCGAIVRIAGEKFQPYNPAEVPVSCNPCPQCRWEVAAATGEFDAAIRELEHPLAIAAATAILEQSQRLEQDVDDPATIQLLVHVARHAPVPLVAEACSEGECEHTGYEPGKCPDLLACKTCSLQHGDWEGEWAGRYRNECLIEAPCAVLLALAEHAGVKTGG